MFHFQIPCWVGTIRMSEQDLSPAGTESGSVPALESFLTNGAYRGATMRAKVRTR